MMRMNELAFSHHYSILSTSDTDIFNVIAEYLFIILPVLIGISVLIFLFLNRYLKHKKIKKEYNRYNLKDLAKKYNLTTKRIKQIVCDDSLKQQLSIFDLEI